MTRGRTLLIAAVVVAVGMNLGLLWLYYLPVPKRLVGDETYYFARAVEFARGEAPQYVPLWPALYSDVMGVLFRVFGVRVLAVQVPQIAMWLATALLYGAIASAILGSRVAAVTAALLLLASPELMAFSHFLWPETAHLFLFALALWLLIRGEGRWPAQVLAGIAFGVALLTKLLLLAFLPVLFGFQVVNGTGDWRRRLAAVALLAAAVAVTVAPTLHHNREVYGRWMIADSTVFNLWVGLTDVDRADYRDQSAARAFAEFQTAGESFESRAAVFRERVRELVQRRGIPALLADQLGKQYFRLFNAETLFTTQLPGGPRAAYRFDAPALAAGIRGYAFAFHAILLGLGAFGLAALRLRPLGWMAVMAAFVAYNLALFLPMHVKTRYLVQFMPMLALAAGITVHQLLDFANGRGLSNTVSFVFTPARVAVGLVAVAAIEVLAFGAL